MCGMCQDEQDKKKKKAKKGPLGANVQVVAVEIDVDVDFHSVNYGSKMEDPGCCLRKATSILRTPYRYLTSIAISRRALMTVCMPRDTQSPYFWYLSRIQLVIAKQVRAPQCARDVFFLPCLTAQQGTLVRETHQE